MLCERLLIKALAHDYSSSTSARMAVGVFDAQTLGAASGGVPEPAGWAPPVCKAHCQAQGVRNPHDTLCQA